MRVTRASCLRRKKIETIRANMHITSTAMMAYIQVRHKAICELWSPSTSDSSSVVFIILTDARLSTALFIATETYSWARRLSSIW